MAVRVALTKHTGALFSDSFSEAIVTEEGAVNIYRNGFGGNTGFAPICGESRFSAFTISGTSSGAALYAGQSVQPYVEWPYLYARRESPSRTVWKVDLVAGTMTQASGTVGGSGSVTAITSRPEVDYVDVMRGTTVDEVMEWTKADEPSASVSSLFNTPSPSDFGHIHLDENTDYWLGGVDGWVTLNGFTGTTFWANQLPVDAASTDYCNGLFAPDGIGGGVAFLEQSDGEMDWFFLDASTGAETDITSGVTIDGVPWDTVAPGSFGAPMVLTTQCGSRIGFRIGTDFYIGVVSAGGGGWVLGRAGW